MRAPLSLARRAIVLVLPALLAGVPLLPASWAAEPPAPAPVPAPAPEAPPTAPVPPAGVDPAAPAPAAQPEAPPAPVKASDFKVKDLDGKERTLAEFAGKWIVLEWTNYGCPFVKKHYNATPGATAADPATPGNMPALQRKYTEKGVVWLSVCSSGLKKDGSPREGYMEPAAWKDAVKERMAAPTAVLLDTDGTMGRAYGVKTTPTAVIIDPTGFVAYQGAVDDQPKARGNPAEAKSYIAEALDAGLAGQPLPQAETKSYG